MTTALWVTKLLKRWWQSRQHYQHVFKNDNFGKDADKVEERVCLVIHVRKSQKTAPFLQELRALSPLTETELIDSVNFIFYASDELRHQFKTQIPEWQSRCACACAEGRLILHFDSHGRLIGQPIGWAINQAMITAKKCVQQN
jgi:hypothetical protein